MVLFIGFLLFLFHRFSFSNYRVLLLICGFFLISPFLLRGCDYGLGVFPKVAERAIPNQGLRFDRQPESVAVKAFHQRSALAMISGTLSNYVPWRFIFVTLAQFRIVMLEIL